MKDPVRLNQQIQVSYDIADDMNDVVPDERKEFEEELAEMPDLPADAIELFENMYDANDNPLRIASVMSYQLQSELVNKIGEDLAASIDKMFIDDMVAKMSDTSSSPV